MYDQWKTYSLGADRALKEMEDQETNELVCPKDHVKDHINISVMRKKGPKNKCYITTLLIPNMPETKHLFFEVG